MALVLSSASAPPAFAVTRNQNGTVTVTIRGDSGIAGANATLHELGIRARLMANAPAGCNQVGQLPEPPPARGEPSRTAAPSSANSDHPVDQQVDHQPTPGHSGPLAGAHAASCRHQRYRRYRRDQLASYREGLELRAVRNPSRCPQQRNQWRQWF